MVGVTTIMSTAKRYNLAWNYVWESYSGWKKTIITNDPDSRQGKEFSREFSHTVAKLAESDKDIPIIKSNYKEELVPSGSNE